MFATRGLADINNQERVAQQVVATDDTDLSDYGRSGTPADTPTRTRRSTPTSPPNSETRWTAKCDSTSTPRCCTRRTAASTARVPPASCYRGTPRTSSALSASPPGTTCRCSPGAGSSLAGQAVGPGCVVVDTSKYMDSIVDVDLGSQRATVQPGVVQDDLDAHLADHGLKFAPDPASSNRATIGGGIGNNSTGAHSVRYGITDAYVEELDVVLADASRLHAREVVLDSPEWDAIVEKEDREADIYRTVRRLVEENESEIADRYPELKRCVSGYNLQKVVYETDDGERAINLAKLLVGAEGTLGVVVEATLDLVSVPDETAVALYCFPDLVSAMEAVPVALDHDPSAVELMDDEVFRLAADSAEYAAYAEPIPDDCTAALMVEFDSEVQPDLRVAVDAATREFVDDGAAFDALEAFDSDRQADLWKLRKAAIPLLMSLEGRPQALPVHRGRLRPARRTRRVRPGVPGGARGPRHLGGLLRARRGRDPPRPPDSESQGRRECGDDARHHRGRHRPRARPRRRVLRRARRRPRAHRVQPEDVRSGALGRVQGTQVGLRPAVAAEPGKVVYRDKGDVADAESLREGEPADVRERLRYGQDYQSVEPQTELDFDDDGGFAHLVELCNGCGTCRQTDSDVMCPTYRASRDEMETTRGRANLLRAAISGDLPEDELYTERFQEEVLDLCVGCKGCASDCPTGVDLAKLKAGPNTSTTSARAPVSASACSPTSTGSPRGESVRATLELGDGTPGHGLGRRPGARHRAGRATCRRSSGRRSPTGSTPGTSGHRPTPQTASCWSPTRSPSTPTPRSGKPRCACWKPRTSASTLPTPDRPDVRRTHWASWTARKTAPERTSTPSRPLSRTAGRQCSWNRQTP